ASYHGPEARASPPPAAAGPVAGSPPTCGVRPYSGAYADPPCPDWWSPLTAVRCSDPGQHPYCRPPALGLRSNPNALVDDSSLIVRLSRTCTLILALIALEKDERKAYGNTACCGRQSTQL